MIEDLKMTKERIPLLIRDEIKFVIIEKEGHENTRFDVFTYADGEFTLKETVDSGYRYMEENQYCFLIKLNGDYEWNFAPCVEEIEEP